MSRTEEQKIEFIENLYPAAKRVSDRTGLAWETILAQAAQETGWGENVLKGTNNIFNIKADSSWKGPSVTVNAFEFDANGNKYYEDSKFRVYGSIDEALEDRVKFLKENPRYAEAGLFNDGVKGNLKGEANALQRAGYATDPGYAQNLVQVFNSSIMQDGIERAGGPKPNPLSDNMLSRDERGDAVKELQQKLTAAGFSTKGTDGYFGQNTEDAVKAYQQSKHLTADGVAGPKTLESLGISLNQTQTSPQTPASQPSTTPATPQENTGKVTPPTGFGTWPLERSHAINVDTLGDPRYGEGRGRHHAGIDLKANEGDPVLAYKGGKVDSTGYDDRAGNWIQLAHPDGTYTMYMHLKDKPNLADGTPIKEGQKIAEVGDSGNAKGLAQLHFEVRKGDGGKGTDVEPGELIQVKGMEGPVQKVKELQEHLNKLGYNTGTPDGNFGDRTEAAVKKWQQDNGLKATGVVDGNTFEAISHPEKYRSQSTQPSQSNTTPQTPVPNPSSQTSQPATPSSGTSPTAVYREGDSGDGVRRLQENLRKMGYPDGTNGKPLDADGKFGPETRRAVETFQRVNGLDVDGVAGPKTLAAVSASVVVASVPDAKQTTATQHPSPANPTPTDKPQTPANVQPTPTDKPQTPANVQPTPTDKPQTPPSSNTTVPSPTQTDKPLMSNPNHPDNKLYQQAVSNLEQLGPSGGFKSREDLEKAAAAVAADAKATGLKEIDHISKTNAPNGQTYLVAVQGDPTSPAAKNSYIDYNQATSQTVAQSTQMAEAQKQATPTAPSADQQRGQDNSDPKPKTMLA